MKRALKWVGATLLLSLVAMFAPVGYIELACRPDPQDNTYRAILPPEHHRPEGRTLLTYPEWHIVHAYDDYGRVIAAGDPHEYRYLAAIGGFWSSLCSLSDASGAHGGFPATFKSTIYTIGVSFSVELAAKALYEETLGRVATWMRGNTRAPLDDLSAEQAAGYATFLQQIPWYRWDFDRDRAQLAEKRTAAFRDRERAFALGTEYRVKAAYARVIGAAVANMEPDALRLRMIVTQNTPLDLDGVEVLLARPEGTEIETPRYRELTELLQKMALAGGDFVEIAGNDDILLSVISQSSTLDGALYSFSRQGYGDTRHLMLMPVADLAAFLRGIETDGHRVEHIHDY